MKTARVGMTAAVICGFFGIAALVLFAHRSTQLHWKLEGGQFLSTNASSQQVEAAMTQAGLQLRRKNPSGAPEPIQGKWSKSGQVWQGETLFTDRKGRVIRILATGGMEGDALISIEGDLNDSLPVLNAFVAGLEAQGIRRSL